MNSTQHIDLLQQLHARVSGIVYTPIDAPENIERVPAVIVRSAGMEGEIITAGPGCLEARYAYQAYILSGFAGLSTFGMKASEAYSLADGALTEYQRASVDGLPGISGQFPRLVADEEGSISHGGLIRFAFNENNVFTAIRFDLVIEDQRDWPGSI